VIEPDDNGARDHVAMFVVTAGEGIRAFSEEAKGRGEFFLAHCIAGRWRLRRGGVCRVFAPAIREDWGFPDSPAMTMKDRFNLALPRQAL